MGIFGNDFLNVKFVGGMVYIADRDFYLYFLMIPFEILNTKQVGGKYIIF